MVDADHAALVRDAALGGEAGRRAETEICRLFAPRIRLYGLRHLHDEDRAADLVQHVLIATLEAIRAGKVNEPDLLPRFVLGTCRNASLRIRQREGRLEPRPIEELDVAATEVDFALVDVEALLGCIAALEARSRTVVQLTFNEERPADEIAASLGTTAANVRVLRHRAVAQLRQCLDAKGGAA